MMSAKFTILELVHETVLILFIALTNLPTAIGVVALALPAVPEVLRGLFLV
jgi:hypothetical protein